MIQQRVLSPRKKINRKNIPTKSELNFPEQIRLERYRYILDRKKSLNENTFKIVSFYQAVALIIGTAQFAICDRISTTELDLDLAKAGSYGLLFLMLLSSLVSVIAVAGGIASWIDYRREEMTIETDSGLLAREGPSLRNALRWYETYIAFGVVSYAGLYTAVILIWIIPIFGQISSK